METVKFYSGCYRVRNGGSWFGHIRKIDGEWTAEIRETNTGDLVQYAGIWSTKRDAVEECEHILTRKGA